MRQSTKDYGAGEMIASLREDQGLSRRDLALRMQLAHPREPRMHVSERTLCRIEDYGAIPTARVKFAIAQAFALVPSEVWGATTRRRVPA